MSITSLAYQGIPGSFSYLAGRKLFPKAQNMIGTKSFRELFKLVDSGQAAIGIVPVENSLAGSVHEVYDLLHNHSLTVSAETYLKIAHHLLVIKSAEKPANIISGLKKVFSHPKALEQCQIFFDQRPEIERSAYSDTAGAAKYVSQSNDKTLAAIASEEAAELYGLQIVQRNVEDDPRNFTRFLVIGKESASEKPDKASLIFTLPHEPASLYRVLEVFAQEKLNVTKIESRPIPGSPFEYNFYIDFEFQGGRDEADKAISEVHARTRTLKILGVYKSTPVSI